MLTGQRRRTIPEIGFELLPDIFAIEFHGQGENWLQPTNVRATFVKRHGGQGKDPGPTVVVRLGTFPVRADRN